MKLTIEIWQSTFNDEWNCDIKTQKGDKDETEYWAIDNFCNLLNLIDSKITNAKFKDCK